MADVRQIVVVGASAGGVEATTELIRALPADLPAAVLMVVHISSNAPSALPGILSRRGALHAHHPRDGEALRNGVVYVAPPDHHLIVDGGRVRVVRGPRENGHRPAIDPLFRSAARHFGDHAVGVVLSGVLDDGSVGLRVIAEAGGVAVVQDPDDAMYDPMPRHALEAVETAHVAPLADIGSLLAKLVNELEVRPLEVRPGVGPMDPDAMDVELSLTAMEVDDADQGESVAPASPFSCPDCHGVLNEIKDAAGVRFRCRVGHAWSPQSLLAAQTMNLETALWMALRTLEEKASLSRRLAGRAEGRGASHSERRFLEHAADAQQSADAIRALLAGSSILTPPGADEPATA
jgi:two-component system chemotaxis response regulator CheB